MQALQSDPTQSAQALGKLPGEAAGEKATTEAERVSARVSGISVDENARQRVRLGLVDPVYRRIGRAILDQWDPARALPEDSAALWVKQRAQSAAAGVALMWETARRYASTGSPVAPGELPSESEQPLRRELTGQAIGADAQATSATWRQYMNGRFFEGRTARVLVEELPNGHVVATLIKASGDRDVDREALTDVRAAVRALQEGQPPPTVRRTVWRLQLRIVVQPPLPVGGFTFDALFEKPEWELPLGRKLLKRVQLEAVYDNDPRLTPGPAADAPVDSPSVREALSLPE